MSADLRLAAQLSACRDMIELVLLDLPTLPPRLDRAPVVSLLERALALLSDIDSGALPGSEHLDLVGAASAATFGCASILRAQAPRDLARPLLQRLGSVQRALEAYRSDALDALVAMPATAAAPREAPRFCASTGTPALHRLERDPLAPRTHVGAAGDEDGEPERRRAKDRQPSAALLLDQLRRLARDCFEELGALGNLRAPSAEVDWMPELARFEARLLADLDAVVALGRPVVFDGAPTLRLDVLRELLAYADDAFVPDPARAFARAFVLGCVEGEDCVRAAVLALRQSDPSTHDAQRSALSLASSPSIADAMEALALGADPALAALALDVLRARRQASVALAAPLSAHPDARVRRSAALHLGGASEPGPAIALLRSTLDFESDDSVASAAAESLVRLGSREGLFFARRHLREGGRESGSVERRARGDLVRVLALAGGAADAAMLVGALTASPSEAAIEAIGWHGHPGSVEPLTLALEDAYTRPAAAALRKVIRCALHRITGAEMEPALASVAPFRAWWRERVGTNDELALDAARSPRRYRLGQPYTPEASLDELSRAGAASARESLALELAVISSGAIQLRVDGWVAPQLAAIASARSALTTFHLGDWPESRLS